MLLVMNTTGLFEGDQPLSVITKDRIHSFLPGLWEEVFKMSPPPLSTQSTNTEVLCIHFSLKTNEIYRFLSIEGSGEVEYAR